jgi:hypothetical protein
MWYSVSGFIANKHLMYQKATLQTFSFLCMNFKNVYLRTVHPVNTGLYVSWHNSKLFLGTFSETLPVVEINLIFEQSSFNLLQNSSTCDGCTMLNHAEHTVRYVQIF